METTKHGWNILSREHGVLWREYGFGGGVATTLVFRGAGDGLIVVSPGCKTEVAALDELDEFGKVVGLVASNGFHWLGQAEWHARFPEARSFAPASAIARLTKKAPSIPRFEPLDAAASLLGDGATLVDPPGLKQGNAFVAVRTDTGSYWYVSDLLANIPSMPSNLVFRAIMSMTHSAPGYRLFRPAVWLQVKDKAALRSWCDAELARLAPTTVVPAHGAPVSSATLVDDTRALFSEI